MSLEINRLLKIYDEQKAVNKISFSVSPGEITGFLGPNGAGKSTTMKIITGYLKPTSGEVYVCGLSVAEQPVETKKKIGYLPEQNPLYYDMYVKEYLRFLAEIHKIPKPAHRVGEVIETVGLTPESRKKIGQLSKGYKQRVGLAAALIHDPEVLILDEPTSGLDPNQILEIREVIRQQGKNKTILFSTHILQEVEALCDRVIIIHKGTLVADDSLTSLKSRQSRTSELKVTFQEIPQPSVFQSFDDARAISPNVWIFKTHQPDITRRRIMELALKENLNILNWETGTTRTLEEIFRSLTRDADIQQASQ
ncbi:MAG: ATP-binding cassette domain-containing protein [Chitinophagaceae bacterium]|nr:ATP-binding cassette domain-containing protein [Chitinophagaceae bacterium]